MLKEIIFESYRLKNKIDGIVHEKYLCMYSFLNKLHVYSQHMD